MLSLPSPLIHTHTYKWRILCSTWQFPYMMLNPELVWSDNHKGHTIPWYSWLHIEGILPIGPYLPCVSMAGRALLAGYHRYMDFETGGMSMQMMRNVKQVSSHTYKYMYVHEYLWLKFASIVFCESYLWHFEWHSLVMALPCIVCYRWL